MKIIGAMFVFMPQRTDADAALAEQFDKLTSAVNKQDNDNRARRQRAQRRKKQVNSAAR